MAFKRSGVRLPLAPPNLKFAVAHYPSLSITKFRLNHHSLTDAPPDRRRPWRWLKYFGKAG